MTNQNNGTKVGTLSDKDIINLCSQGCLIVDNYSRKNVHQSCYELRASQIYYDITGSRKKYNLSSNEYILIKPRQLVVVITMETISLPPDILARILTKGKLFSIGLLPVNTYADPGFYGNLEIVFYDLSNNYLKIFPLVVQKTLETLMDKGFSSRQQIWDFSRDRTKAMVFRGYFDRLGCPS